MRNYRYRVSKTLYPYGPNDPVEQVFYITVRAGSDRHAEIQAANIGIALGLILVGPI
jgi:hypothetical protein